MAIENSSKDEKCSWHICPFKLIQILKHSLSCHCLLSVVHNNGEWPLGEYALPNVHRSDDETACPPGFLQHHFSLLDQKHFFDLELLPSSLGPYFLEVLGHNFSALNIHFCERDKAKSGSNLSSEAASVQWPKGDYCVLTRTSDHQCPPGKC